MIDVQMEYIGIRERPHFFGRYTTLENAVAACMRRMDGTVSEFQIWEDQTHIITIRNEGIEK